MNKPILTSNCLLLAYNSVNKIPQIYVVKKIETLDNDDDGNSGTWVEYEVYEYCTSIKVDYDTLDYKYYQIGEVK